MCQGGKPDTGKFHSSYIGMNVCGQGGSIESILENRGMLFTPACKSTTIKRLEKSCNGFRKPTTSHVAHVDLSVRTFTDYII